MTTRKSVLVIKSKKNYYILKCRYEGCNNFFTSFGTGLLKHCQLHTNETKNAKIVLRINGLPEDSADLLVQLAIISGKSIETIVRNTRILQNLVN